MKRTLTLLCLLALLSACGTTQADDVTDDAIQSTETETQVDDQTEAETDTDTTVASDVATEEEAESAQEDAQTDVEVEPVLDPITQAVHDAVHKQDDAAQIAAVVAFDAGYAYNGTVYEACYNDYYFPETTNSLRSTIYHDLDADMQVDEQGYLVFLEGQAQPSYYVEADDYDVSIVKSAAYKNDALETYYAFIPFPDEQTMLEYSEILLSEQEKLQEEQTTIFNMEYYIEGTLLELTSGHLHLQGTASRDIDGDSFTGLITVALDSKDDVYVHGDGTVHTFGFSAVEDPTSSLTDGVWNGYQCYIARDNSTLTATSYQNTITLENIAFLLEIMANEPVLTGETSQFTLDGGTLSLTIPTAWTQAGDLQCTVGTLDGQYVLLQQSASVAYGGTLCEFWLTDAVDEELLDMGFWTVIYEQDDTYLLVRYPTDVQFTTETQESYMQMYETLPDILNTLTLQLTDS